MLSASLIVELEVVVDKRTPDSGVQVSLTVGNVGVVGVVVVVVVVDVDGVVGDDAPPPPQDNVAENAPIQMAIGTICFRSIGYLTGDPRVSLHEAGPYLA